MVTKEEIGSYTAKGGFENEDNIVLKFQDYKNDKTSQKWLNIMGYDFSNIQTLKAIKIPPRINKDSALSLGVSEKGYEEATRFKRFTQDVS